MPDPQPPRPRAATGRPWIYDEPASESITMATTPAQLVDLKRIATENGVTLSRLIRDAVNDYVATWREQHPVGRRRSA